MMVRSTLLCVGLALLACAAAPPRELKSGPQVGESVPGGFAVKCSNGLHAGKNCCPVLTVGYGLVALIFAREIDDDLTGLVKKLDSQLDEATRNLQRQRSDKFGVFVILLTDDADAQKKLGEVAAREGLKHVVLSAYQKLRSQPSATAGPVRYKVAKEADVTVAVYREEDVVTANFALQKGGLTGKKVEAIQAAVARVLPR